MTSYKLHSYRGCFTSEYQHNTAKILPRTQEQRNSKNTKNLKSNSLQIGTITKYSHNKDVTPSGKNVWIISVLSIISGIPKQYSLYLRIEELIVFGVELLFSFGLLNASLISLYILLYHTRLNNHWYHVSSIKIHMASENTTAHCSG